MVICLPTWTQNSHQAYQLHTPTASHCHYTSHSMFHSSPSITIHLPPWRDMFITHPAHPCIHLALWLPSFIASPSSPCSQTFQLICVFCVLFTPSSLPIHVLVWAKLCTHAFCRFNTLWSSTTWSHTQIHIARTLGFVYYFNLPFNWLLSPSRSG